MTTFEGIVPNLERRYKETDSDWSREKIEEYMSMRPCPECDGARLRPESRAVKVGGIPIHEFTRLSAKRAIEWMDRLELSNQDRAIARLILREIDERLRFLDNVGVGYLSMERASATLSGGEAQRIRLATQIGSSLVGVLYILDEPSIGLHQRDNERLIKTLERLRDLGNTVLVVEHDEGTMRAADYVVDMGPGAGEHGGHVVARGTADEIMAVKESLTGQFLAGTRRIEAPGARRKPTGYVEIIGATQNNLKNVDVEGPARRVLRGHGRVGLGQVDAGQRDPLQGRWRTSSTGRGCGRARTSASRASSTWTRSSRSTSRRSAARRGRTRRPTSVCSTSSATSTPRRRSRGRAATSRAGSRSTSRAGAARSAAATARSRSRCTSCRTSTSRASSATASATTSETLDIRFKGKTIADVLDMPVEEALEFFAHIPKIRRRLQTLHDVGLDYMRLGQPATTLSGGEAQRIKLASELAKVATGRTLYILDEPTTGLHFADIQKLLEVLQRLVDAGNSVVVIEHNLDVIKTADRIIDMGPEGGEEGGTLMAAGTPGGDRARSKRPTPAATCASSPNRPPSPSPRPASAPRARSPRRPERDRPPRRAV